jgi:hypothetical protein
VARTQVWLRDRQRGVTTLVSRSPAGVPGNADSLSPRIAGDGRSVVYVSLATNIVDGLSGNVFMILRYDVVNGTTTLLSATDGGVPANNHCEHPAISGDGTVVAFDTAATNLWPDTSGQRRILVRDLARDAWSRVDVSSDGVAGNGVSQRPSLTSDGRHLAFESNATNLSPFGLPHGSDVFVHNRLTGATQLVTTTASVLPSAYSRAGISADGEYVASVVASMQNSTGIGMELVRFRRATLVREVVARTQWGESAIVWTSVPQLSHDGSEVMFTAPSKNLVPKTSSTTSFPDVTVIRAMPVAIPADLTSDGAVNAADLAVLLGAWGKASPGDLDGDGEVGATDFGVLFAAWTG